jgi:hypothetical protein
MWSMKITSLEAINLDYKHMPSCTLEKEAEGPAETLVNLYQTTQRHILEASILLKKKHYLFSFLSHHGAAIISITVT